MPGGLGSRRKISIGSRTATCVFAERSFLKSTICRVFCHNYGLHCPVMNAHSKLRKHLGTGRKGERGRNLWTSAVEISPSHKEAGAPHSLVYRSVCIPETKPPSLPER